MLRFKFFYFTVLCLLVFLGILLQDALKYKILSFTLDEQIFWYDQLSWEETKLPTYRSHGIDKIKFFLKDREPLPKIENTRKKSELDEKFFDPEGLDFYYAYPLSRLQVDLFIDKVEISFLDKQRSIFIDKDSPEDTDSWRFTSYQKPRRKKTEILTFLTALANFQTEEARDMLVKNNELLPFNGLHFDFKEIIAGKDKLYGSLLFEWWWGPELYDFQLFISGTTLYFLFTVPL